MNEAAVLDSECFQTTDGEIAIVNLNSARLRSWNRFLSGSTAPRRRVCQARRLQASFNAGEPDPDE
jgi:hypothetical protein